MTCTIDGCSKTANVPGSARGFCRSHYRRWQRYGDPTTPLRKVQSWHGAPCSVDGCDEPIDGRGLCRLHLVRMRATGRTDLVPRPRAVCSEDGCSEYVHGRGLCHYHYDQTRIRPSYPRDPEKARLDAKRRRARLAGATGDHTHNEWVEKLAEFDGLCAYCPAVATTKDHVVPITRGGSHSIANIVPACRSCNSSKRDRTLEEWRRDGEVGQDDIEEA